MRILAALILVLASIVPLRAQDPRDTVRITLGNRAPKRPGPRAIAGIVVDTQAVALDSVDIYVAGVRRHASSGADGSFRFADIGPGIHRVAARRLGYFPQVQEVVVGPDGGVVTFVLLPMGPRLPPIVSSSPRGGLSGVIGDTAYNIIEGALIEVLGGGGHATSDSTGSFFVPASPGRHMVRIRREGFATRIIGVTIPRDSGRRILAWMKPATKGASVREQVAAFDLEQRINRARPMYSRLYTREDINNTRPSDLMALVARAGGGRMREDCGVFIDGGPRRAPIWGIPIGEIESVEVYLPTPRRNTPTSIMGRPAIGSANPLARDCPSTVYVWLRQ